MDRACAVDGRSRSETDANIDVTAAHGIDAQEAAPAGRERPRLARELHSTVVSVIAVIALQAGAADHTLERCQAGPGRPGGATGYRAASLQELAELRATVATLRGVPVCGHGSKKAIARRYGDDRKVDLYPATLTSDGGGDQQRPDATLASRVAYD